MCIKKRKAQLLDHGIQTCRNDMKVRKIPFFKNQNGKYEKCENDKYPGLEKMQGAYCGMVFLKAFDTMC